MTKLDFPSFDAIRGVASMLACDVSTIMAIAEVESGPQGAFLDSGEPVILFEPHIFSRLTQGEFDGAMIKEQPLTAKWAHLSYPKWRRGWYGPTSVQHTRLQAAISLSKAAYVRDAALMSCSWGLYQLMGFNYELCGFDKLQRFVNAMYRSVDDHLWAFARFVRKNSKLVDAVRQKDMPTVARIYNGPGYKKNGYDVKLASAEKRYRYLNTPLFHPLS